MRDRRSAIANVMLAEENSEIRTIISEFLKNQGYSVKDFHSADDLESALPAANPDFILMNVGERDMSGVKVLRHIRTMTRFDHVPVVMLSGEQDPEVTSECVHQGADGVLTWPYSAEVLSENMKALLSGQSTPLNPDTDLILRSQMAPPGPMPDGPSAL